MIRTATATAPTGTTDTATLRTASIAALQAAVARFEAGDARAARAALMDARAMIQEQINRDADNDALHIAYNATNTAGMLVPGITPQYASLAIDSLSA